MTVHTRAVLSRRCQRFVAVAVALLAVAPGAPAQGDRKGEPKLPKGVTALAKDDLRTRVPNFFYFDYPNEPQPGKRLWLRVDDRHFIERYPDGLESKFKVLGRATVNGVRGTIVVKVAGDVEKTGTENDGNFQVFIADRGKEAHLLCRRVGQGESEWFDLGEMKKVE